MNTALGRDPESFGEPHVKGAGGPIVTLKREGERAELWLTPISGAQAFVPWRGCSPSWKETHLKTIAWTVCCSERNCVARTFHLQNDSWMTGVCTCFTCHSLVWLISFWGFGHFDKTAPLASLTSCFLASSKLLGLALLALNAQCLHF